MGQYYGPKEFEQYAMAFWHPKEWLLESGWSKEKQDAFDNLYNLGTVGIYPFRDMFDKILNNRDREYYLYRNQLDWSHVRDPRKLTVIGTGALALNWVSDNFKRLYR